MKKMKKIFAILLALVMTLALGVTAFATGNSGTNAKGSITVNNPQSGVTYTAYQIFDVTYNGNKTAYSYTITTDNKWWGVVLDYMGTKSTNEEGNVTITRPTADSTTGIYTNQGITLTPTAADSKTYVATVGKGFSAASFAEYLLNHKPDAQGFPLQENDDKTSVSNLALGYYLVVGTYTENNDTKTQALAELTTTNPDVTIYDKNEGQIIDKKQTDTVDSDGNPSNYTDDSLNVQIGDTVYYQITGRVPDTTGYATYTWEVSDILTDGLTLNTITAADNSVTANVKIKVGNEQVWPVAEGKSSPWTVNLNDSKNGFTASVDFTATGTNGSNVESSNFYNVGQSITIAYSATINENAKCDIETNKVTLTYSNNPANKDSKETYEDETKVYDASISVIKYDGATGTVNDGTLVSSGGSNITYLSGASFVLYKENNDAKSYYKYMAADANTSASVSWVGEQNDATVLTTDSSGKLSHESLNLTAFVGLEDGTYYLLETAAPAGYNLLQSAVPVTINGANATANNLSSLTHTENVANNAGSLLPSTGGTGTAIFYILGAILVVGAGVMLVVKRRMSAEK